MVPSIKAVTTKVRRGIIGTGEVEGAADGLPCAVIVLPGLAAGLAGAGIEWVFYWIVSGPRVERGSQLRRPRSPPERR
jgi:hypothetical protein